MTIGAIREDFPALAHWTHLNSGGISLMPRVVAAELLRLPTYVAEYGPVELLARDPELTRAEAARRQLADFLGLATDEIAFTTQFSTGINIVIEGLPWRAGDEIIITDQEHPALLTPVYNMARRTGLTVRRLAATAGDAAVLDELASLLTPRTRLVAVSHVTTETGTRLPLREIARLAHQNGTLVLADGAQSVGQFPVDVPATECDFYTIIGYKWLLGPYPSAALAIRRAVLDQIEVTWTGSGVTETAGIDMDQVTFIPGARRFEYGGRPYAHDSALAVGAAYLSALGLATIEAHAQRLAGYLHQGLARLGGTRVHSTLDLTRATGIVTYSLEGVAGTTLATALRERWKIVTRPALHGTSVRVSIAAFTNEHDLDRLLEATAALAP